MKRVKIFKEYSTELLENAMNNWLAGDAATCSIIDVKYSTSMREDRGLNLSSYSALVLYEIRY